MKIAAIVILVLFGLLTVAVIYVALRSDKDTPHESIMLRYTVFCGFVLVAFGAVLLQIIRLQFIDGDNLRKLSGHSFNQTDTIRAQRGNILSEDRRLMAATVPEYYVTIDMNAPGVRDIPKKSKVSYFERDIDALSDSLSKMFKDATPAQYKAYLTKGYINKRPCRVRKEKISYTDYQRMIHNFPLINKPYVVTSEKRVSRTKPYGGLASRTIGDTYGIEVKGGRCGLEKYYNNYLKGQDGLTTSIWLAGKKHKQVIQPAVDGCNIISTINIDIQEEMHNALLDALNSSKADAGVAILMEASTGKIIAISNLGAGGTGYIEKSNYAFSSEIEPGSTFKTLSLMVALEDGKIDTTTRVDTYNGLYKFYDRAMKDHNYNGSKGGGYGVATVPELLYQSSNVGISRIIYDNYAKNPQDFIDGIRKTGFGTHMDMEIPGAGEVKIKPVEDFSKTTLPWMSIGYEVTVPPIYMLTFYNAIANNGRMMKPMFVTSIERKGEVVKTFEPEVIKEKICSDATLGKIRKMLEGVVTQGTAKAVASDLFPIAGKTGTSQITNEQGRYKDENGIALHQITFCGYFPSNDPKYTCLVYIKNPKEGPRSAGRLCGGVFKRVAEKAYICDSRPQNKSELDLKKNQQILDSIAGVESKNYDCADYGEILPDVTGKTLQEATYMLENNGWSVSVEGVGRVKEQIPAAGTRRDGRGDKVKLKLM
ncbi:MAG: transpeptidase family protein [Paludibacteraceae bacterium]|nr:transpeptidase family protein [Paludibacteraceae bacterium]